MLRLEELAFIKALSTLQLSPVFLWELRKAMVVGSKKTLAATKANISSLLAFEHQCGTSSEDTPPMSIRSSLQAKEKLGWFDSSCKQSHCTQTSVRRWVHSPGLYEQTG
jgi:hypothetical protein